jgi:hypothetical protein
MLRSTPVPDPPAAAWDAAAADLLAAAADSDAAADCDTAVADLLAVAGLLAAGEGAGLVGGEPERDAIAATGTAIAVAARTPATATRRLRTDITRSFIDWLPASPATPPKTNRPATLKQPRKSS